MRLAWGTVSAVVAEEPGLQRLEVELPDGIGRALCYPRLSGACASGDRVLLNTTAVDLALGTGGVHFVVARETEDTALDEASGGRIMKLRYTPLQLDVASVEEQHSPHHAVMRDATDLGDMPVVCCGLHSQLPLVAAAVKARGAGLKVAYVMTDQAALPIALSDVVRASLAAGLIDATVTCGQAFGGQLEAVTPHSGLLAARHVAGADVAVVAIGPGVVGTATPFGHGGIAQGEAINATACLGGVPVAVLRLSFADERARHRGVSHHTLTALARVATARAVVRVPVLDPGQAGEVDSALKAAGISERHECREVRSDARAIDMRGVEVRTMGRSAGEDPAFFEAAFAAGDVAAGIALAGRP